MRVLATFLGLLLLRALNAQSGTDHPIDGALLPTRATLLRIPSEHWEGLPRGTRLPARVDLRPWLPPPGDQGRQNACIAFALAYGLKSYQETVQAGGRGGHAVFSPAFPYNLTKLQFDTTDTRCLGSYFTRVFSVLVEQGCCAWNEWPYDTASMACFKPVPAALMTDAAAHTLASPMRVAPGNLDQLRYHLMRGTPVAFAMGIDTAFKYGALRSGRAGQPFRWRPACAAPMPGSHAMLVVGYDDADSTFLVMNSWGTTWGEGGFCRIRYEVFDCHVTEAYVALDALEGADATSGEPEVDDDLDARERLRLRVGESVRMEDLEVALVRASDDGERVRLALNDSAGPMPDGVVDLHRDHSVRVQRGDDLLVLDYVRRAWLGKAARIVLTVLPDTPDADVERSLRQAGRIEAARNGP